MATKRQIKIVENFIKKQVMKEIASKETLESLLNKFADELLSLNPQTANKQKASLIWKFLKYAERDKLI